MLPLLALSGVASTVAEGAAEDDAEMETEDDPEGAAVADATSEETDSACGRASRFEDPAVAVAWGPYNLLT